MRKVLNRIEVDALMNLVQKAEIQGDPKTKPELSGSESVVDTPPVPGNTLTSSESVHVFDFKKPERVSAEQLACIEALHESFARNLSASLSGYLRTTTEMRLISVEELTYSEFTMSVPSPTIFTSLSCKPLSGNMIVEMNPSIVFPFIDRLLGGGSVGSGLVERPFTAIEQGLINTILNRIMSQFEDSWKAIQPLQLEVEEVDTNPMLMQIVAPHEPVLLLRFEVTMGESSGLLNYCIPLKVIEPIIDAFAQTSWLSKLDDSTASVDRSNILDNLRGAGVDVSVTLAEVQISLSDFLTMKPGDILDCDKSAKSEVLLQIREKECFRARPGVSKNKKAVVISEMMDRNAN